MRLAAVPAIRDTGHRRWREAAVNERDLPG
jgi:hypothetical protein